MRQLYFAYGSNLNPRGMEVRCPAAVVVGRAALPDWGLVFRGVADVEPQPGATVEGALWEVTDECLRSLDRYEGARPDGTGLYRREWIETLCGSWAITYVMNRDTVAPPSPAYLASIHAGFDWLGIPLDTLEAAVHESTGGRYENAMA
jgi:gamma-glutamylcyclotransferase (GGCT)/AIG2-like uncharacterized protein YtfP